MWRLRYVIDAHWQLIVLFLVFARLPSFRGSRLILLQNYNAIALPFYYRRKKIRNCLLRMFNHLWLSKQNIHLFTSVILKAGFNSAFNSKPTLTRTHSFACLHAHRFLIRSLRIPATLHTLEDIFLGREAKSLHLPFWSGVIEYGALTKLHR